MCLILKFDSHFLLAFLSGLILRCEGSLLQREEKLNSSGRYHSINLPFFFTDLRHQLRHIIFEIEVDVDRIYRELSRSTLPLRPAENRLSPAFTNPAIL